MGSSQVSLGSLKPWSSFGEFNNLSFLIQQALSKLQTATLVQVQSCSNDGGVSPIGTVNVLPLVNQLDGNGNPTPHVTVYGLPYLRIQGGANAVVIDPQPGDIGVAVFASRDISTVQRTKAQANPGSSRRFSFSDGIYLSTVISAAAPQQYIQFNSDGISILTPGKLQTQSSGDTDVDASGNVNVTASGNVVISGESIQAGSSPEPVCSKALYTWVNSTLLPALAAHSITVGAPPTNSLTSTFEAS